MKSQRRKSSRSQRSSKLSSSLASLSSASSALLSGGAKLDNNVSSGGGGGGGDDLRQHVSNYLFTLTKSFSGSDDKAPLVLHVTVNINPQSVAKSSLPSSKGDFAAPDAGGSTIAIRIYELSHGAGSLSLDREWCIKSSFIFSSGGGCGAEVVVSAAISPAYVPPSTLPNAGAPTWKAGPQRRRTPSWERGS